MADDISLPLHYAKLDRCHVRSSVACACVLPFPEDSHSPHQTLRYNGPGPVQLHALSLGVVGNTALDADSTVVGWSLYAGLHGKTIYGELRSLAHSKLSSGWCAVMPLSPGLPRPSSMPR